MKRQITVLIVLGTFAATLLTPLAASASSKGRRNTALLGTAATVYLLARHRTGAGLVAAAGTAYAWKRYNDSRRSELRGRYYRYGYNRGYGRGYYAGRHSYARRHHRR